jgi:hypothetical protein
MMRAVRDESFSARGRMSHASAPTRGLTNDWGPVHSDVLPVVASCPQQIDL